MPKNQHAIKEKQRWDKFYRYTAAPTLPEDLEFISPENEHSDGEV